MCQWQQHYHLHTCCIQPHLSQPMLKFTEVDVTLQALEMELKWILLPCFESWKSPQPPILFFIEWSPIDYCFHYLCLWQESNHICFRLFVTFGKGSSQAMLFRFFLQGDRKCFFFWIGTWPNFGILNYCYLKWNLLIFRRVHLIRTNSGAFSWYVNPSVLDAVHINIIVYWSNS